MAVFSSFLLTLVIFISQAQAQHAVTYLWPSVNGLTLNNACATEKTFRSVKPISFCAEYKVVVRKACELRGDIEVCRPLKLDQNPHFTEYLVEQKSCMKTGQKNIEVSRAFTSESCDLNVGAGEQGASCGSLTSVQKWAGLDWQVPMYDNGYGDPSHGGDKHFLGMFDLHIPACAQ